MDSQYFSAFAYYLKTGDSTQLRPFLQDNQAEVVLSIYRNGFYKACIDALAANYSVTKQLLGEPSFNVIAKKYVDIFPPTRGSLVGYGELFIYFLAMWDGNNAIGVPAIAHEIAMLDRAWLKSLNSKKGNSTLTAEAVMQMHEQGSDPGQCLVCLDASVSILKLNYNSFELWHELRSSGCYPEKFTIDAAKSTVMFWRLIGQVHARVLTGWDDFFFFKLEQKKLLLGELLEDTVAAYPDFDVTEHFAQCLQNQLLAVSEKRPKES